MSEPKPTWTIGTNEFDAEFVAKWIGNTDHNYDTYITALKLRIDALCDEVGRLRGALQEIAEHRNNFWDDEDYRLEKVVKIAEEALE